MQGTLFIIQDNASWVSLLFVGFSKTFRSSVSILLLHNTNIAYYGNIGTIIRNIITYNNYYIYMVLKPLKQTNISCSHGSFHCYLNMTNHRRKRSAPYVRMY